MIPTFLSIPYWFLAPIGFVAWVFAFIAFAVWFGLDPEVGRGEQKPTEMEVMTRRIWGVQLLLIAVLLAAFGTTASMYAGFNAVYEKLNRIDAIVGGIR